MNQNGEMHTSRFLRTPLGRGGRFGAGSATFRTHLLLPNAKSLHWFQTQRDSRKGRKGIYNWFLPKLNQTKSSTQTKRKLWNGEKNRWFFPVERGGIRDEEREIFGRLWKGNRKLCNGLSHFETLWVSARFVFIHPWILGITSVFFFCSILFFFWISIYLLRWRPW